MSTEKVRRYLNNATPGLKKAGLGDRLLETEGKVANLPGAAVDDAAGAAPTAAEFDALLASLRAAGVIAES